MSHAQTITQLHEKLRDVYPQTLRTQRSLPYRLL
jgi:hypothetical protein